MKVSIAVPKTSKPSQKIFRTESPALVDGEDEDDGRDKFNQAIEKLR